jgi:hypothetical protein
VLVCLGVMAAAWQQAFAILNTMKTRLGEEFANFQQMGIPLLQWHTLPIGHTHTHTQFDKLIVPTFITQYD